MVAAMDEVEVELEEKKLGSALWACSARRITSTTEAISLGQGEMEVKDITWIKEEMKRMVLEGKLSHILQIKRGIRHWRRTMFQGRETLTLPVLYQADHIQMRWARTTDQNRTPQVLLRRLAWHGMMNPDIHGTTNLPLPPQMRRCMVKQ
jgi:hypothetical protein